MQGVKPGHALVQEYLHAGLADGSETVEGAQIPLASLKRGQRGKILFLSNKNPFTSRLKDLGFVPGSIVQVRQQAPLLDPTEYEVRGSRFCLRRSEARNILVTLES